jgi:hypothetical protein
MQVFEWILRVADTTKADVNGMVLFTAKGFESASMRPLWMEIAPDAIICGDALKFSWTMLVYSCTQSRHQPAL